jgi:multidrug transporter EmrE-like cation transporter
MKILLAVLYSFIGQVISFMALQGSTRYEFIKNNQWLAWISGMISTMLFMKSVSYFVGYYNGQVWPSRIFGFVVGLVVFSLMSYFLFNEKISLKTAVCLGLCIVITLVQLLWKN